eukprot:TRINITY_DN6724_c0_g1_i14.p1 TRINITY_DN6724_c0_g1~~TRINITY_DN6724_c0_g1_i14.p1  ORF type:complete len:132 (+),score=4.69 TRINITY_DN6724_c0_g1_i14:80-475(+)
MHVKKHYLVLQINSFDCFTNQCGEGAERVKTCKESSLNPLWKAISCTLLTEHEKEAHDWKNCKDYNDLFLSFLISFSAFSGTGSVVQRTTKAFGDPSRKTQKCTLNLLIHRSSRVQSFLRTKGVNTRQESH